jgi:hypothetical protein
MTNFFIIKPNRCTNFTILFWHETLQVSDRSCSKSVYKPVGHIPLLTVQWMNSWWWTDELSETFKVSCQNKIVKLVHLVGFIIKKCVIRSFPGVKRSKHGTDTQTPRSSALRMGCKRTSVLPLSLHRHVVGLHFPGLLKQMFTRLKSFSQ